MHAGQEGSKFALQLLYLMDATAFYSPALWLLRQRIVRISGGELVSKQSAVKMQHLFPLDAVSFHSPALWLLRQHIVRISGSELSGCVAASHADGTKWLACLVHVHLWQSAPSCQIRQHAWVSLAPLLDWLASRRKQDNTASLVPC